jgi:hypothetical protein
MNNYRKKLKNTEMQRLTEWSTAAGSVALNVVAVNHSCAWTPPGVISQVSGKHCGREPLKRTTQLEEGTDVAFNVTGNVLPFLMKLLRLKPCGQPNIIIIIIIIIGTVHCLMCFLLVCWLKTVCLHYTHADAQRATRAHTHTHTHTHTKTGCFVPCLVPVTALYWTALLAHF